MWKLKSATLAALCLIGPTLSAAEILQDAFYQICVNGRCTEPASVLTDEQGTRWIEDSAFDALGIESSDWPALKRSGVHYVDPATHYPQARIEIDESALQLWLALPGSAWPSRTYSGLRRGSRSVDALNDSRSAYLDYALYSHDASAPTAYGEIGLVQGSWLLRNSFDIRKWQWQRGMTALEFDDAGRRRRWIFGDQYVVPGDAFGAAGLIGGIGVASAYDLDPYMMKGVGADVQGIMAAPGTVDIYANGRLVARQRVEAGPFLIHDIALAQGSNDVRIVINDPFVGTYELASAFYGSSRALAPGLHEYGYRFGRLRPRLAADEYDSGNLLSMFHRYGFSRWFTAGARYERSGVGSNAGISADVRAPVGVVGVALARSDDGSGRTAWARRLHYSYQSPVFAFGFGWQRQDQDYAALREVAFPGPVPINRGSRHASLSFPLPRRTSVSFRYHRLDYADDTQVDNFSARLTARVLGRTQAHLEAGRREFVPGKPEQYWQTVLLVPLGRTGLAFSASQAEGRELNMTASAHRSRASYDQGWGYRAELGRWEGASSVYGEIEHAQRAGILNLSVRHKNGAEMHSARYAGGLLLAGGKLYPVTAGLNGHALVRTGGTPDVPILRENRPVGRTDGRGHLLVSNLYPYHGNLLSVDHGAMDIAQRADDVERYISVGRRGVAYVDLRVHRQIAVEVRLVTDKADEGTLRYGQAWLDGRPMEDAARIGPDGDVYLEDIEPGEYLLRAVSDGGVRYRCRLDVPHSEVLARLGEVQCARE